MIAPRSTTWDLGRDRYGRPVSLTLDANGFAIRSEPISQLDEGEKIYSLTRNVLIAAGKIAEGTS